MKTLLFNFTLLCLSLYEVTSKTVTVRYDSYKVFRVNTPNDASANFILNLPSYVDIWAEPRIGYHSDIMVAPRNLKTVEGTLKQANMDYSVMVENVQTLIDIGNTKSSRQLSPEAKSDHPMSWDEYHSQDDMEAYMDYLVEKFPDMVSTEEIGYSYEGRTMRVLKICKSGVCGQKPGIWFDGGIHAREWVSPSTTTFMMKELVENSAQYPSELLDKLDWYILPVLNPDGYEYSRTSDRMWRKSRSPNSGAFSCTGTDLNRNWGYHWNEGGSSDSTCSDAYHGPDKFSEVENRNVRDFLMKKKDTIKFYNNIHSYSQLILLPWGYTDTPFPKYDRYLEVANEANKALKAVHGKNYEVGCIPCVLYIASGGTTDWVYGEAGIPYAFAMELRDTGLHGFLLPPEQIIPTGEEVMAFHVSIAQQMIQEFVP